MNNIELQTTLNETLQMIPNDCISVIYDFVKNPYEEIHKVLKPLVNEIKSGGLKDDEYNVPNIYKIVNRNGLKYKKELFYNHFKQYHQYVQDKIDDGEDVEDLYEFEYEFEAQLNKKKYNVYTLITI
jgi:hypothetical protein